MVSAVSMAALAAIAATLGLAWWRRIPMVMAITIANFLVFVLTIATGFAFTIAGSPLLADLAARVSDLTEFRYLRLHTILTATFLHSGIPHIIGNMLVLLLAGLPFEDRVGRARFLLIYFVSAVVAVLLHAVWVVNQTPHLVDLPLVGASGAVFGILAAFATLYPNDRIPMFLVFIILPRVPVYIAAIVLTAVEAFILVSGPTGGVAHAAHIGGAVGGLAIALVLRPRRHAVQENPAAARLDYEALERLAPEPHQRTMIDRLRENEDQAEAQRAWLDRLLASLRCPRCGQSLEARRRGRLACANGHEEAYAR